MTTLNFPRQVCQFNPTKTDTFRLASRKFLDVFGNNMQNIEKSRRRNYVPDGDKCFIQADQAGAEALIVAYLCKPGKFRDLFLYGIKPHVYIGLAFPEHWTRDFPAVHEIATLPIPEIKNHPGWKALEKAIKQSDNNPPASRYYYIYKQTCHSSNYDIKAPTFIMNVLAKSGGKIALTRKQGDEFINKYRSFINPELIYWHMDVRQQVTKTRYLRNLQGYPRYFYDALDESDWKKKYAFIPQSTVGTITNEAITKMQLYIIENGKIEWDVLNNCHDSLLCQCPVKDRDECASKMKEFLEVPLMSPRFEPFKMKCELQWGFNWAPANAKYNPNGLQDLTI